MQVEAIGGNVLASASREQVTAFLSDLLAG